MAVLKRMAAAAALVLAALPGLAQAAGLEAAGLDAAGFDVDHATQSWLATLTGPARARSDA